MYAWERKLFHETRRKLATLPHGTLPKYKKLCGQQNNACPPPRPSSPRRVVLFSYCPPPPFLPHVSSLCSTFQGNPAVHVYFTYVRLSWATQKLSQAQLSFMLFLCIQYRVFFYIHTGDEGGGMFFWTDRQLGEAWPEVTHVTRVDRWWLPVHADDVIYDFGAGGGGGCWGKGCGTACMVAAAAAAAAGWPNIAETKRGEKSDTAT